LDTRSVTTRSGGRTQIAVQRYLDRCTYGTVADQAEVSPDSKLSAKMSEEP
jgi:hypothetical protein